MKKNMKGFTLIELLAVIVILGIIMVVAVPQILDVINSSRTSAWDSNVKLIKESIELKSAIQLTGDKTTFLSGLTSSNVQTQIASISDISSADTVVSCAQTNCKSGSNYVITVAAATSGKFKGQTTRTITCTAEGSCTVN